MGAFFCSLLYRGKLYESRKRQGERTDLTLAQNGTKFNTAEELSKEYGLC